MIPPVASDATRSAAERDIFQLLKQTDLANGICLHSLNLSEHRYKLVSEVDFLVCTPRSILVLEVKGGRIARRDGIWTFTDRFGNEHRKSEGPFEQARSAMFAVRDRLRAAMGGADCDRIVFGFGVLMPDCDFDVQSVEWASEMIFDAGHRRRVDDLHEYLDGLEKYWRAKHAAGAPPTADVMRDVRGRLRPDFDRVPSLSVRSNAISRAMESLTEEQYAYLDCVEENPRILCSGGAGTGKTFLAAEYALRQSLRDRRTLLTCVSPILASFLASRVRAPGVHVASLSELRAASDSLGEFDVVVVDEGQDLINPEALDVVESRLAGGWGNGNWCVFYDANTQDGISGRLDRDSLEFLRSSGAVSLRLTRNCRNTIPVATQTRLITGGDLGTPMAGDGPSVRLEFYKSDAEQGELLKGELNRLRGLGIAPGDITILSTRPYETSCAARVASDAGLRVELVNANVARGWPRNAITAATVSEFKGLENSFVLVTDVDSFDGSALDRNTLYVAMSRARVGLWVAIDQSLRAAVTSAMQGNLSHLASH